MPKPDDEQELTHFDARGASRMVDVSSKPVSVRTARAVGRVRMRPETVARIQAGTLSKGNVFEVARLAGIMAAKKTGDLVPLCHPLGLDAINIEIEPTGADLVRIESSATVHGRTGVEMEALTAVAVAALTLYDMCKAIDRGMVIESIRLVEKTGGRSGAYRQDDEPNRAERSDERDDAATS